MRNVRLRTELQQELEKDAGAVGLAAGEILKVKNLRVGGDSSEDDIQLLYEEGQWLLRDPQEARWPGLRVDFEEASFRYRVRRSAQSKEILRDALKVRGKTLPLKILDATAGLGEDGYMMAHWGYEVLSYERHPLIFFLLAQGWKKFRERNPEESAALRWELRYGDSAVALREGLRTDVLYLDPMFPPNSKKALNKKELRILHELIDEAAPTDAELVERLRESLPQVSTKVILKRPQRSETLGCPQGCAYYAIEAPSTRLDIFHRTE